MSSCHRDHPPFRGALFLYICIVIISSKYASLINIFSIKETVHVYLIFVSLFSREGTAHYAGLLGAPAEGFGLWPKAFFGLWVKKVVMLCLLILGLVWCSIIISVTLIRNLSNFEKVTKVQKKKYIYNNLQKS